MLRVLILGATGMLGHELLRELSVVDALDVYGSVRSSSLTGDQLPQQIASRVVTGVDAEPHAIEQVMRNLKPEIVVNCIGVIKQHERAQDPVTAITINSLFPHVLARECVRQAARLIHVSTDCVFSGDQGDYREGDIADARDVYGRSKLLGETTAPPSLTIRTSIIGHELKTKRSLVDWFLSQTETVNGYRQAIYSGLTATAFARMLASAVFPRSDLAGLYHVSSTPISKYELLCKIAAEYKWQGQIVPFDDFRCDRSLCSDAFFQATGYRPGTWDEMIAGMHQSVTIGSVYE